MQRRVCCGGRVRHKLELGEELSDDDKAVSVASGHHKREIARL